jgi:hypothetical protein
MKKITLFLFIFISMKTAAQTISMEQAERFVSLLVQKEILNNKGKEVLLEEMKKENIEVEFRSTVKPITHIRRELTKETILQFCSMAFAGEQLYRIDNNLKVEQTIPHEDSLIRKTRSFRFVPEASGKYTGCLSNKRSILGYTRSRTLKEVKDIGLISDTVYTEAKSALADSSIEDEVALMQFLTDRSVYYTYYEFNRQQQTEYIEKITAVGLLTEEEKSKLLQSYKPFELKSVAGILAYSDRCRLIDLANVTNEPAKIYQRIFEAIKTLIPSFNYTHLQTHISETRDNSLMRQDLTLSFKVDTNLYTNTLFYHYYKIHPEPNDRPDLPAKFSEGYHEGINKWLTDAESPYRLYTINTQNPIPGYFRQDQAVLLLLKEGEADLVSKDVYVISRESYDRRLSKKNIEKLLEQFTEVGLFKHLSKEEMDLAKMKVASNTMNSIEDILMQFPKTIVVFDWESGNLKNPYEELTTKFSFASRGAFTPTNITDEYKKGWEKAKKIKYSFTFNSKKYEAMLPFKGDWLEPEFLNMIKRALKENNVDGDIYYCIDNGQEGGYIFLTEEQYRFIKENYPDLLKEGG